MERKSSFFLVRNIEAGNLLENFLVSAILSVLGIRVFLHLTGFPQFATSRFHIAHVLFGGLLMMIALVAVFGYINKEVRYFASFVGGIGFGAFIDELGKFITRDNNYFYQPTIAIIYVIFVIFFLLLRSWERNSKVSDKDYAVNALEYTKEALLHDLDFEEKKKALYLIEKSDQKDPLIVLFKKMLKDVEALPHEETWFTKFRRVIRSYYRKIVRTPWFNKTVIVFFVLISLYSFTKAFFLFEDASSFFDWGQLISTSISGVMVLSGIYLLQKKNILLGYESFKLSILISIFLTQFFLFYKEQLSAVLGLIVNIFVLNVLQYLIEQKELSSYKKKDLARSIEKVLG